MWKDMDAEFFRAKAAQCRRLAQVARSQGIKAVLKKLAQECDQRGLYLERRGTEQDTREDAAC